MAEDYILCTCRLDHLCAHLAGVGALLLVGAVLGPKSNYRLVEELCDGCQVDKRGADNHTTVRLVGLKSFVQLLCKSNTFLEIHVHLPVSCYNFLSHCFLFFI